MPKNELKYCQQCRYYRNRPGTCTKQNIFMARKMLVCKEVKPKKGA